MLLTSSLILAIDWRRWWCIHHGVWDGWHLTRILTCMCVMWWRFETSAAARCWRVMKTKISFSQIDDLCTTVSQDRWGLLQIWFDDVRGVQLNFNIIAPNHRSEWWMRSYYEKKINEINQIRMLVLTQSKRMQSRSFLLLLLHSKKPYTAEPKRKFRFTNRWSLHHRFSRLMRSFANLIRWRVRCPAQFWHHCTKSQIWMMNEKLLWKENQRNTAKKDHRHPAVRFSAAGGTIYRYNGIPEFENFENFKTPIIYIRPWNNVLFVKVTAQ